MLVLAAPAAPITMPARAQSAPDIVGAWHGVVASPQGEITLALHVTRGEDGALSAKIENVDQGPGDPADITDITVTGDRLEFRPAPINAAHAWPGRPGVGGVRVTSWCSRPDLTRGDRPF